MNSVIRGLLIGLLLVGACEDESSEPSVDGDGGAADDGDGSAPKGDGQDGDGASDDGESGDGDGGTGDGDGEPNGPPVYAIVTQVFAPMGQTSYVVLTDSLVEPGRIELADAIELPGRAIGAGPAGGGALFVGGSEDGVVQRYDLSADGKALTPGLSVSFAGLGITTIGEYQEQFQFVSDRKAYYLDGRTAQMVVFDPTAMLIDRSVELDELVVEGQLLTFSTNVLRRAEQLVVPVAWRSDTTAFIPSEAAVVRVDMRDDSVAVLRDDRCGYVRTAVEGPDGRLYVATEAYGSAVHRVVPANAAAPCLLRLDPEWNGFDASFYQELSTLVGGATAGTLLPGPSPDQAWLRVLDEGVASVGPATNPRALASTSAWAWWNIALGDEPVAEASKLGLSNGSDFLVNTDDAPVIPEFSADRSETVLRDMRGGTPGESSQVIPGLTFSIVRLR